MKQFPPAIFLMGPTASGKTSVAVELAQRMPVEIISVDSALVYRGMDIGTAKPDAATRARAPHHLIDIISPDETYSAAAFRRDALRLMHDITSRNRIPLLAGGTMLYFKALREGLDDLPQADPTVRAALEEQAARTGWPAMHGELSKVDPATAARLKPNDSQRVQRALEIYRITGTPMSALLARQQSGSPLSLAGADMEARNLPYRITPIALVPSDRSALHARIATRFAAMLKLGLAEELRALQARYALHPDLPAMRCVGYRQAWQFLAGEIGAAELLDKGIAATRQLAKRQLTWLRSMPGNIELDCLAPDLLQQAADALRPRE
ncbi:MAG: tRNA (adenosine(37)-N6)-dimethylallyltransferase MiaA [Nitrosomonadales bacterium]|nr:tRNA (adenosine(37)-N6)-dimethylallyltransferase MiaA [Nitrosomonadales bacterium]